MSQTIGLKRLFKEFDQLMQEYGTACVAAGKPLDSDSSEHKAVFNKVREIALWVEDYLVGSFDK